MILFVDNFDSFSYNLIDLIRRQGVELLIYRNNEIDIEYVHSISPQAIVISPGPGKPEQTGKVQALLNVYLGNLPVLGICLGHQLVAQLLGAKVVQAIQPMHGKTSLLRHTAKGMFAGLPQGLKVMRYHSLIVTQNVGNFEVTATSAKAEIMAISNVEMKVEGLQFHPESILTEYGEIMIQNWLNMYLC